MKPISLLSTFAAAIAISGVAQAYILPPPPAITTTADGIAALGTLTGARGSSDNNSAIGCSIRSTFDGSTFVMCHATDPFGTVATCTRTNPNPLIYLVASGVNTSSRIFFQADKSGQCTTVAIDNQAVNLGPSGL